MRKYLVFLSLPLMSFALSLSTILHHVEKSDLVESKQSLKTSAEFQLEEIKSAYLPQLKATAMYAYLRDEDKGFFDPELNLGLSASYVLFDGFKRADLVHAQKLRIHASAHTVAYEKERLSLEAVTLYCQLRTQKVVIEASIQKIKQLHNEVARLEKLFDAQIVAEDDLESVKASLAMSEYELHKHKQNYINLRFNLQTLSGLAFDKAEAVKFLEPEDVKPVLTKDILAKENELKALQWQADAQTSSYLPQIVIKDTYSNTQYYESSLSIPGGSLPERNNKLELLMSWTLIDFGTQSKAKQKMYLQKKALDQELNFYKKSLKSRQEIAKMQLATSRESIRSATLNLRASQKSFEFRHKRFNANLINSTIYLDALTRFTQAKALLEQSRNDYEIAKANYYFNHNIPLKDRL